MFNAKREVEYLDNLFELYNNLKNQKIMFCYCGPIGQSSIEGVGNTLKRNLEIDEAGVNTTITIFSVFIEQVQNILNYSAERLGNLAEEDNELRVGVVIIGREESGNYFTYCGNKILNEDIGELEKKIDYVNSLNKDELKLLYKERRRMEPEPGSKGAGLGLIDIARKVGRPLEYKFSKVDDTFSFFSIKTVVGG